MKCIVYSTMSCESADGKEFVLRGLIQPAPRDNEQTVAAKGVILYEGDDKEKRDEEAKKFNEMARSGDTFDFDFDAVP